MSNSSTKTNLYKKHNNNHNDMMNRLGRICLFIISVYITLKYLNICEVNDSTIDGYNMIKLIVSITIWFIIIDTYMPRVDFD
jgi:hypothetical protein